MLVPDCSEPDDEYPNNINAMLRDIKRYRWQMLDPEGYRKMLNDVIARAGEKKIKGSKEGGKKE
jgi:hypothetical protein